MARKPSFPSLAAIALAIAITLGGCTPSGDYPSLAIRDVERAQGRFDTPESEAEPAAPARSPQLSGDLTARIATLKAAVAAAHADFLTALPQAKRRVAAAGNAQPGTAAWGAGQVALADLAALHSKTALPAADFEQLYVDTRLAPDFDAAHLAPLDEARATIVDTLAAEDAALAALKD